MAACTDQTELLHGLLDGELDAVNALACERHLKTCTACNAEFLRLQAVRELVTASGVAHVAPDALRARIMDAMREDGGAAVVKATARRRPGIGRWAGGGMAGAIAAGFALVLIAPQLAVRGVEDQVVASHVRSLLANHLIDVVTSNQHVVKPWFNGKVDFAPPVYDLVDDGFPLAGGRLDYIGGRVVPALVYHRHLHTINLFVWPAKGAAPGGGVSARRDGYSLVEWRRGGLEFWAVSDIDAGDLEQFHQRFAAHSPG